MTVVLFERIRLFLLLILSYFSLCANFSHANDDDEIEILQPYFDYPDAPLKETEVQEDFFKYTQPLQKSSFLSRPDEFKILPEIHKEDIVVQPETGDDEFSFPKPYLAMIEKDDTNHETKVFAYYPDEKNLFQIEHFNDSQLHRSLKPCINGAGHIVVPFSRPPSSDNPYDIFNKLALAFINPFYQGEKSSFILLEDEYSRMEPLFYGVLLEEEGVLFSKRNLYLIGLECKVPKLIASLGKEGFYQTNPSTGQVFTIEKINSRINLRVYETYSKKVSAFTCGSNIKEFSPKVIALGSTENLFILRDIDNKLNLLLWNLSSGEKKFINAANLFEVYEGYRSSEMIFIHAKDDSRSKGIFEIDFDNQLLIPAKDFHPITHVFPDAHGLYNITPTQFDESILIKRVSLSGEETQVVIENAVFTDIKRVGHHFFFQAKEGVEYKHFDFNHITLHHLSLKNYSHILEFSPHCEVHTFLRLMDISPHDFDSVESLEALFTKREKRIDALNALGSLVHKIDESEKSIVAIGQSSHLALTLKGLISWIYPEIDKLD